MLDFKIVNEWRNPLIDEKFQKQNENNAFFYIAQLQQNKIRYLKIGTTSTTIQKRFNKTDYKQYSFHKFLYVMEIEGKDKQQSETASLLIESFVRNYLILEKGFTFKKNDRFKYFSIKNKEIKIYTSFDSYFTITL